MVKKIIAAVAALIAIVTLAPTAASAAAPVQPPKPHIGLLSGYSACDQIGLGSAYGSRVCLDPTTGYGPVILIYSSGNTVIHSFGVSGSMAGKPAFVASATEYAYVNTTQTNIYNGSNYYAYTFDFATPGCISANDCISASAANHDLLEWYANVAGYEFIKVD